ncbi:unnamed protein product [Orchesella dallaii]|uniref:Uncharacterized protein n=1 Tax=Orchesella dallaii TaxID=48710 RepID=A0ABP1RVM0_9HEXA
MSKIKDNNGGHWKAESLPGVSFIIPTPPNNLTSKSTSIPSLDEDKNNKSGAHHHWNWKVKVEEGEERNHADEDGDDDDSNNSFDDIDVKFVDVASAPLWRSIREDHHNHHLYLIVCLSGEAQTNIQPSEYYSDWLFPSDYQELENDDDSADEDEQAETMMILGNDGKSEEEDMSARVKNKIRQAKRRLRIRLTNGGASPEEIEREFKKLMERYMTSSSKPSTSSKRRTNDDIRKRNRLRQAKRRLKLKLRQWGASPEIIEMELSRLENKMCDDEGKSQFQEINGDFEPRFSDGDTSLSNFNSIPTQKTDEGNEILQPASDPNPLFFPTPHGNSLEAQENEVDTLITSYNLFPTFSIPKTPRKPRTREDIKASNRIRQARRRLRIRLMQRGASPEEIGMELARFAESHGKVSKEPSPFHVGFADTHFLAQFTSFSSQTNEEDEDKRVQSNLDPISPSSVGEPLEEPEVNMIELSSEYLYVGRATLDNMVNEASSEDDEDKLEQHSDSHIQEEPLLTNNQVDKPNKTRTKSSPSTLLMSETRRKRKEYMRKYRKMKLEETLQRDKGTLIAIIQHEPVKMERDEVQIKQEIQNSGFL